MATLLPSEVLNQLSSFFSWYCFSVYYTHASFYSFNDKRQVIKYISSYNPPITFARLYWLHNITCTKSPDSFDAITTIYVDICPRIIYVEKKQRQRKRAGPEFNFFLALLLNLGEERSHFVKFKVVMLKC